MTEMLVGNWVGSVWTNLVNYFMEMRVEELPMSQSYKNMRREARAMFYHKNLFTGANIVVVRPLSNPMFSKGANIYFAHNFLIGSKQVIPHLGRSVDNDGYQLQCQYSDKSGKLSSVLSTSLFLAKASRKFFLAEKCTFVGEMIYTKIMKGMKKMDFLKLRANFKNANYCLEGRLKTNKKKIYGSFSQAVSQNLTLGTKVDYNYDDKKTDFALALRYDDYKYDEFGMKKVKKPSLEFFAQMMWKDLGVNTHHVLKTSFWKKIEQNTKMGVEMNWDLTKREASLQYGYEQSFLSGSKVRAFVNNQFHLTSFYDFHFSPKVLCQVLTQAKPFESEYKLGINMQFQ